MATYIGKVTVDGKTLPVGSTLFGVCETLSEDKVKKVDLPNFDELIEGVTVHVKFLHTNFAEDPSLNVNGTGNIPIYRYGTEKPGKLENRSWHEDSVVSFTYDGSSWRMNDWQNVGYDVSEVEPKDVSTSPELGSSKRYAREDHIHAIEVKPGSNNGEINIAGKDVKVTGLGEFAYKDTYTKSDIGLSNVENKSPKEILSELTKENVTDALGFVPVNSVVTKSADGLVPKLPNENATTKFLRQDGTWSVPPDKDTTYFAATATPIMDGTPSVGSSIKYAREDHVHPTDTSRVPVSRTINGKALSGNITLTVSDIGSDPSKVSTTTTINGHSLSSDVNLTPEDIGAVPLSDSGLIDSSYLPSYVDDVIERETIDEFPITGETGKIYVERSTNLTYRWSGTSYVEISKSLALGTTSGTAFRGDLGEVAYNHATDGSKVSESSEVGLYKIGSTAEGHISALEPVTKDDIEALGAYQDVGTYTFTGGTNYFVATPAKGEAQVVRITPSIQNNIVGRGSAGHLAEFSTTNTIVAGPEYGDDPNLFLRNDGSWATPDTGKEYSVVSRSEDGLVPKLPSGIGTSRYLREDGTWAVPPDTVNTYDVVSKTADGLVPQLPNEETTTKYLREDGTWAVPPDTVNTYNVVSKTADGLVPQLPNEETTTKYLREDGTWAVPPDTVNTYNVVSKTADGLVPQLPNEETTTKYLREDGTWAEIPDNSVTIDPAINAPKAVGSSSVGTSAKYAREDHSHSIALATGDSNGQVKIAGTNVSVKGLGSAAYTESSAYIASTAKGAKSGVAELDSSGKVPSSQLPTLLTLGTTSSTAFRGDYGNAAYNHAVTNKGIAVSSGLYKITTNAEGHVSSVTAVQKSDITDLDIPSSDTTYNVVSKTADGLVPKLPNNSDVVKYLRQDGTWAVPPDTVNSYSVVSKSADGLVPQLPNENTVKKFLRQDGTWAVPPESSGGGSGVSGSLSLETDQIGSASLGTAIAADDITAWSAGTAASASASKGVVTFTNGSAPSLSYTARSIPNVSVERKSVVINATIE